MGIRDWKSEALAGIVLLVHKLEEGGSVGWGDSAADEEVGIG